MCGCSNIEFERGVGTGLFINPEFFVLGVERPVTRGLKEKDLE